METFLTLILALGGIATGIDAIWAAIAARRQGQVSERQAQLTERSLAQQRQSFQGQTGIARHQARLTEQSRAEQNERGRLNLEVDLLLRLEDRFVGPQLLDARRGTARYTVANFIVDGSLLELDRGRAHPTFADALALVRKELWAQERTFCGSPAQTDTIRVPRVFMERLTDTVCYAAQWLKPSSSA